MRNGDAGSGWMRLAPWAGIAFVALFVIGFVLLGETPSYDDAEGWQEHNADSGNRTQQIIGGYALVLSAFAFLFFARMLSLSLTARVAVPDPIANLANAAAILFTASLLLAAVFGVAVPASVSFGDAPVPDSDIAIQFEQAAIGILLIAGCLSASLFIVAISTLVRRLAAWPGWLVWAGFIVSVLLLLGPLFIPVVLIPLWVLAASILLIARPLKPAAPE